MRSTAILLTAAFVALAATGAEAQGPDLRPFRRPTTSPYLNLLQRNGAGIGFNYYRSVKPEFEFRRAYEQQYQTLRRIDRRLQQQEQRIQSLNSQFGPTGHTTSFLNYGGYYPRTR